MNLELILKDEQLRKQEFPVVESSIYLAHAAVSPLPRRVTQEMQEYLESVSKRGQFEFLHRKSESGCRHLFAQLLEVKAEEIALSPSTSASLSMIAEGLDWKPGDHVLVREGDFPANIYPWLALERRGVQVRKIPVPAHAEIQVEDVLSAVDDHTRLVSLSSVDYLSGLPIDVDEIGKALHDRGVLFCLDAIQSLGAIQTSAKHVDFLAADAHKWLMGPQGIGVMMVKEQHWSRLSPVLRGWKSVESPSDFHRDDFELEVDARRYEPGSLNAVGVVGLNASLELLLEVGISTIQDRIVQIRNKISRRLIDAGVSVLESKAGVVESGIVSFKPNGNASQTSYLHNFMTSNGIEVSLRKAPNERSWIRLSPGFYQTDAEIEAALESILANNDG